MNKRLPIAVYECKERMHSQQALYEDLKENKAGYFAAQASKRLITDGYGRGVVRGAVEIASLILQSGHCGPTKAESVKTARITQIALRYLLQLLRAMQAGEPRPTEPRRTQVDKLQDCPPWTLYGGRGTNPAVHALSAYEFPTLSLQAGQESLHRQLAEAPQRPRPIPRRAHRGRLGRGGLPDQRGGSYWALLGTGQGAKPYRHDWIIAKRKRPLLPVAQGAHASKTREEQAMRILVLFFPWVNDPQEASLQVPFVGDFWRPDMTDWCQALWVHAGHAGFPTKEAKTLVLNFVFAYCLPRELQVVEGLAENSDNAGPVDELEDLELDEDELLEATATHVRGSGGQEEEDEMETPKDEDRDVLGAASTKLHDLTTHMRWAFRPPSGTAPRTAAIQRPGNAGSGWRRRPAASGAPRWKSRPRQEQGASHAGLVGGRDAEMGDVEARSAAEHMCI